MKLSKRPLLILLLVVVPTLIHAQQEQSCEDIQIDDQMTLREFMDKAINLAAKTPESKQRTKVVSAEESLDSADRVSKKTTVGAAPSGFASRVNQSIEDFLPIIQGAVNGVTTGEDNRFVTVQWNPLRIGDAVNVGISTTINEPQAGDAFREALVEGARTSQTETIESSFGDFEDITWALKLGYQRGDDPEDEARRWMAGRNAELYEATIGRLMAAFLDSSAETEDRKPPRELVVMYDELMSEHKERLARAGETTSEEDQSIEEELEFNWKQVRDIEGADAVDELKTLICADAVDFASKYKAITAVTEKLPTLINNQPQLVLTASRRDRDPIIGQDSNNFSLSFEMGTRNLNRVLRKAENGDLKTAFKKVTEGDNFGYEDKFTFKLDYVENRDLSLTYDYVETTTDASTGNQVEIPRTLNLDLPESSELCGKFQWSRFVGLKNKKKDDDSPDALLALSAEFIDVDDDDMMRQDRAVATLTYAWPVNGSLTIPLTLTYANRSEFLGDQDEVLSANFGLSYKFSRTKKDKDK